ncbi:MAG: AroM family protein [Bacillota bacterium]
MRRVLGTVTIGQSPRSDLIPEMKQMLDQDVVIIEAGALDGLTLDEVKKLYPEPGDYVLITRMADGTAVKIAEKHILPKMQQQITNLVEKGAEVISLVCTGEFPDFDCPRLVVRPQKVLFNAAASVAAGLRLGVFVPDIDQIPQSTNRWAGVGTDLRVEAASPYESIEAIQEAAAALRDWRARVIVMDCIGYTLAMKRAVKDITGVPVILARSVVARMLAELL